MSDKQSKSWSRLIAEEGFAFGKTAAKIGLDFVETTKKTSGVKSNLVAIPKTLKSDLYIAMTKGQK